MSMIVTGIVKSISYLIILLNYLLLNKCAVRILDTLRRWHFPGNTNMTQRLLKGKVKVKNSSPPLTVGQLSVDFGLWNLVLYQKLQNVLFSAEI